MSAATQLKTIEGRKAEVEARIDELMSTERTVNAEIGGAIARGKSGGPKLREKRSAIREELEDLVQARPALDREIEKAKDALRAERLSAAQSEVAAVVASAGSWGAALRAHLAPVLEAVAQVPEMQAEFDRTRQAVATLTGTGGGSPLNERITARAGLPDGIFTALKGISDELG